MNKNSNDKNSSKNGSELLKRLLKKTEELSSKKYTRPSDELIWAYITNDVTDTERKEIEAAMAVSADFRREIHELVNNIDYLKSEEAAKKFKALKSHKTPKWLVDRFIEHQRQESISRPSTKTWLSGLTTFFTPKKITLATAVIVLLIILALRVINRIPNVPIGKEPQGEFLTDRSGSRILKEDSTTAEEEAPADSIKKSDAVEYITKKEQIDESEQYKELEERRIYKVALAKIGTMNQADFEPPRMRSGEVRSEEMEPLMVPMQDARMAAEDAFSTSLTFKDSMFQFMLEPEDETRISDRQREQKEAEFRHALESERSLFGNESPLVADILLDFGRFLEEQRAYSEGESLISEAIQIYKRALGAEHLRVAECLDELADLFMKRGKYSDAEPLYLEALEIRSKILDPDHLDMLRSLTNLNRLLQIQGGYITSKPPLDAARHLQLQLTDNQGNNINTVITLVPTTADSVNGWLLAVPTLELYQVEFITDSVQVTWDRNIERFICTTFTFKIDKGFLSTWPVFFKNSY